MIGERIPLRRVKTMRKTLSGKNMLNDVLKEHPYRLAPDFFSWFKSNYSPIEKHERCEHFGRMFLHSACWCSSLAWGSSGVARRDVGFGVPAGGRDNGKQGPQPEEKTLSFSTVGLCDWACQLPGGR